ncbi:dipeptide/oligopeptide/nickel ABC transporter permease/ATP-binding protein [Saccharomonospora glauca]|uniref:Oligopeptide/dipeptide ABC transporter, ATP-binding protein n=1 Tax=Saccharomonospora glauca K62 TaxID=928724 RepID=I1D2M8_9PSEU|nr:dipeptide/oligopeptide/nickel ABC transporter permease/ATP-binding protein [Saccharomonospora glauca]EIE99202.1 oligopeptide/dipeptide ABC transporter, ATP-binding protein [Saccharomonospora glauca K62]
MRSRLATRLSRPGIRFRALRWPARIALLLLTGITALAVFGPLLAPDPLATGVPAQPPSAEHWFGTDRAGRDVFARVVAGARYSLVIGLGATVVAVVVGSILGGIAATSHKVVNETVMRVLDVVMAFPGIALAAVLIAVFGPGIPVLIIAIALVYVPSLTRVVRANVLAQYGEDYVAAEKVIGAKRSFILIKHVAVNCAAPVVVFATVLVADAIIYEASLSFIGAGIQDPLPSWGNVLSYGRQILLSGGWWATFFPGVAILLTVLALNVLSEGLTDAWSTPKTTAPRSEGAGKDDKPGTVVEASPTESAGTDDVERALARLATTVGERTASLPPVAPETPTLLSVRDLRIRFPERHGDVAVVDGVSFDVKVGETLGLVGESGCGKSLTSLALMGLLPRRAQVSGSIVYDGKDLLSLSPAQRRALAGPELAMVYQDAMSSLNPSVLVGTQLRQLTRRGGTRTPEELLELVGLSPERCLKSYPHELSGGQRQRVLIAMALSRSPRLLIADEPTTALDVTVQAQVVELLAELRDELGFAMVLVSHDLALIGEMVHRVAVMYAGQLAEVATVDNLFAGPRHHYARGLLGSVLSLESGARRLHQIPGVVPAPGDFAAGCRFVDRCPAATDVCRTRPPVLSGASDEHTVACWNPADRESSAATEGALL